MALDRLWAGWRSTYIASTTADPAPGDDACVFCRILASGQPDDATYVLWRGPATVAILNAYPYTSGHLMVLPRRHVADLEDLAADEAAELWVTAGEALRALRAAYEPEGVNLGVNLGRAAGAGVPGHVHVHLLPRWNGDTNFVTTVAEARVLPEALPATWEKLRAAWPRPEPQP